MKVRFIKDWHSHYAGDRNVELENDLAYRLIRANIAIPDKKKPERMVDERPEKESR